MTVLPRNNTFIQRMLNDIDPNSIPNDEYFLLISFGNTSYGTQTVTASITDGTFLAFINTEDIDRETYVDGSYYISTLGYSDTGSLSGTYTTTDDTSEVFIICSLFGGTLTGSYVNAGKSISLSKTINMANFTATLTNNTANGVNVDNIYLSMSYASATPADYISNGVLVKGYLGTVNTFSAMATVNFHDMPASLCTEINSNWKTGDDFKIRVYSDGKCYVVKSTNKLDISSYVSIDGDLSGMADTLKMTVLSDTGSMYGEIDRADITASWWSL